VAQDFLGRVAAASVGRLGGDAPEDVVGEVGVVGESARAPTVTPSRVPVGDPPTRRAITPTTTAIQVKPGLAIHTAAATAWL
jgi:hypothetical protein